MSNKILITGCSSGFGLDAAKTLANKGHQVYATMREADGRNAAKAQELRDFVPSGGGSISVHDMDVTSDASVRDAVAAMDRVDVLVNNAGYGYGGPVESFESEEILAQLDLNIVGTARVASAVLPGMRERGDGSDHPGQLDRRARRLPRVRGLPREQVGPRGHERGHALRTRPAGDRRRARGAGALRHELPH